jgi:hypothetical protein
MRKITFAVYNPPRGGFLIWPRSLRLLARFMIFFQNGVTPMVAGIYQHTEISTGQRDPCNFQMPAIVSKASRDML